MNTNNRLKGIKAETQACGYLVECGFKILARNYSMSTNYKGGEIDIIAKKGDTVHFIEVKARYTDMYGEGREAVTYGKQSTIRKIATRWLLANNLYDEVGVSFDVIEITDGKLEHYENCF